ncbi:filament-like plant protein 1 [Arabidopsis lyrata subsp. lyrata]|uniref:filament-like plant protein 1 n=1 Tax=Arabidopsis lyrata subsp. lyrata TaxID=81972 RepID=UPI000A29D551|nr:filament-like plant protein 1 [Arabidopsis lyrata subsp. lyrata]XP_020890271.1 filament-like plant protein 1 [Arabidopsis lyrata subsp. lyrata]XP_020890272.1 filament-like plant protein 1 [Arabidopsis lyrata subsp. lyrata]|eukprot:XP_020890270.1 filament-like plant protein 1 [Arabidopsis lyrata subsp. lyrata]
MEKRKRESSERSFGESEESVSSLSEKKDSEIQPESTMESHDDDEIQQSPTVSLEVETENEDLKDSMRTLTEKLSAALANVSAKDDLVKQHVKVAEEAVAGWEKAENEVVELKEKLEAGDDKNRVLEDRVSHLDGALKECVRQLRQARDEQEQRIQDAVIERTQELQSSKTSLENQILETATKSEELSQMAESVAKENVMLRHELLARCEELEIRTIERDLSTQAAETASKQQLDSIKKVAKLEAECRKLRMLAKSSASFNDHRSTDSHSDGGERMDVSCSDSWASSTLIEKRSLQGTSSSIELDLMGDFLEMERLVALPETPDGNGKSGPEAVTEEAVVHSENSLAAEIEVLTSRTKELEEKLEKLEAEKHELEKEVKCNREEAVVHVENSLAAEIEVLTSRTKELEEKLEKLEAEKNKLENEFKCNREEAVVHIENSLAAEIEVLTSRTKELEEQLEKLEAEKDELESEVKCNREEAVAHVENWLAAEIDVLTCRIKQLEEKLSKLEAEKDELKCEVRCNREVESTLRFELEAIACDKMELENKLEKLEVEKAELQISFDIIKDKYKESQVCLQEIETKLEEIQTEIRMANELKAEVESQIIAMEDEAKTKSTKIKSLEEEMRKERIDFDELRRKCEALEEEISLHKENSIKSENKEPKIKQEDIETAAGKLANCQKTIASLGKQLQSLATLEDFLTDTPSIPMAANGVSSSLESWKVHKNETFMARNQPESIKSTKETSPCSSSSAAAAVSMPVSTNRGSSEKNRNGFATVFTRSKDGIHLAI